MSDPRTESPLSGIELVVLASLAQSKSPSDDELGKAVLDLCLADESPDRARAQAVEALTELRERGLVNSGSKKLTDKGGRALRAAFGVVRRPTWSTVRDRFLPAFGLALHPGAEGAAAAVRSGDAIVPAVLRWRLGLSSETTPTAMCDALIAEALQMPPGKITLDRIRAHVLARRAGVMTEGTSVQLAGRIVSDAVGAIAFDKASLATALGRRWVRGNSAASGSRTPGSRTTPPLYVVSSSASRPAGQGFAAGTQPVLEIGTQPPPAGTRLLEVVREAIAQVGADGRFGAEKVFVSALWHRIEHAGRPADLSLDHFKRWLVSANREGALVLARADVIGAMDARQVAESEIRDEGSTFHFVLDLEGDAAASQGGSHVR